MPVLKKKVKLTDSSSDLRKATVEAMEDILSEIKQKDIDRVVFKNEQLHRFFPTSYTSEQMRREILEILKIWMNNNWNE